MLLHNISTVISGWHKEWKYESCRSADLYCFGDHSLEEQVLGPFAHLRLCHEPKSGSGISFCFKVTWRLCGAGDDSWALFRLCDGNLLTCVRLLLTCSTVTCWGPFWENRASALVPLVRFTSMPIFFFYNSTKLKSYFGVIVLTRWRRSSTLYLRWSTNVLWSWVLDPSVLWFIVLVCLLFRWSLPCLFLVTEVYIIILLYFLCMKFLTLRCFSCKRSLSSILTLVQFPLLFVTWLLRSFRKHRIICTFL